MRATCPADIETGLWIYVKEHSQFNDAVSRTEWKSLTLMYGGQNGNG
jgi:hypothetical protein